MRFNLRAMLYGVAVLAAGMGAFGLIGLPIAALVLWFWAANQQARWFVVGLFAYVVLPSFLGMLLIPSVNSRPSSRSGECANNLRQIALALVAYKSKYGTFPPTYIADQNGKPMHSWRTLILPYIERGDIYSACDFSEPWDGPNNRQFANVDISLYRCPSDLQTAGKTSFFAIVGPKAAWVAGRGRKIGEFLDGTDQTLLLIEAVGRGVNWVEPKDLSYDEALALLTTSNVKQAAVVHSRQYYFHYKEHSRNVVTADAQAGRLPKGLPDELASGLLTIDGGEPLDDWRDQASSRSRLHLPRIWGIAVFIVLTILPWAVSLSRRKVIEESHRHSLATAPPPGMPFAPDVHAPDE